MTSERAGWRPIETVPHRGEAVLLYDEEWEMTLGSIQIGVAQDGTFIVEACPDFNPTHWMPLPDPPAPA